MQAPQADYVTLADFVAFVNTLPNGTLLSLLPPTNWRTITVEWASEVVDADGKSTQIKYEPPKEQPVVTVTAVMVSCLTQSTMPPISLNDTTRAQFSSAATAHPKAAVVSGPAGGGTAQLLSHPLTVGFTVERAGGRTVADTTANPLHHSHIAPALCEIIRKIGISDKGLEAALNDCATKQGGAAMLASAKRIPIYLVEDKLCGTRQEIVKIFSGTTLLIHSSIHQP